MNTLYYIESYIVSLYFLFQYVVWNFKVIYISLTPLPPPHSVTITLSSPESEFPPLDYYYTICK